MPCNSAPSPLEFPTAGWWAHRDDPDRAWYFDGNAWSSWVSADGVLWIEDPPARLTEAPHTHLVRCVRSPDGWVRGDLVRHHTFGYGEVLEVSGHDHTAEAYVRFLGAGIKHLSLRWARLEKVL